MVREIPEIYRRASDAVAASESIGEAITPGVAGGSLADLENIFAMLERAVPLFERFSRQMMAMREFEHKGGGAQGGAHQGGASSDPPVDLPRATRVVDPPPAPAPAPAPTLSPLKIYSRVLGELAKLPPATTAGEALELARANKELVLSGIRAALPGLMDD